MLHITLRKLISILTVCLPLTGFAEVGELDNPGLERLRADGVAIIDVRRVDEWKAKGMIEGSHGITFFDAKGNYDVTAWLDKVGEVVQPDQPVVLICDQGVRSSKIAEFLDKRLGYTEVHNVTGGISAWIGEDLPVVDWQP